MEYDAMTRSTSPFWRNGSRLSEIVSFQVISAGLMPSEAARILPISGSKPLGSLSAAPLNPMPGWSYFTPMTILPLSASSFILVPASKLEAASSSTLTSTLSESSSPALPQAASEAMDIASPTAATVSLCRVYRMESPW
jgi:hypothetical protein